jgi:hypothetical protein
MQSARMSSRRSLFSGALFLFSGPTTVLISSLLFIGSVVVLHIWGKISS